MNRGSEALRSVLSQDWIGWMKGMNFTGAPLAAPRAPGPQPLARRAQEQLELMLQKHCFCTLRMIEVQLPALGRPPPQKKLLSGAESSSGGPCRTPQPSRQGALDSRAWPLGPCLPVNSSASQKGSSSSRPISPHLARAAEALDADTRHARPCYLARA